MRSAPPSRPQRPRRSSAALPTPSRHAACQGCLGGQRCSAHRAGSISGDASRLVCRRPQRHLRPGPAERRRRTLPGRCPQRCRWSRALSVGHTSLQGPRGASDAARPHCCAMASPPHPLHQTPRAAPPAPSGPLSPPPSGLRAASQPPPERLGHAPPPCSRSPWLPSAPRSPPSPSERVQRGR
jgi:hypothetical protein